MGEPTMTEELEQLLKNLKPRRILEIYDEQLRAADKDDISYSDFVTRLVSAVSGPAGGRPGMAGRPLGRGAPICPSAGPWRRSLLPANRA
jgi:hypothetical protein